MAHSGWIAWPTALKSAGSVIIALRDSSYIHEKMIPGGLIVQKCRVSGVRFDFEVKGYRSMVRSTRTSNLKRTKR